MRELNSVSYLYWLIIGLSLSGCVSEDTVTSSNQPPVAVIDANDRAVTGELVLLNGSQSSDVDGDSLSYQWELFSAPVLSHSTLNQSNSDSSSFVPDVDGDYTISLIVNDGQVASSVSKITVRSMTVNTSPTADAGVDQSILTGQIIQLSGAASHDIDEDTLIYLWSLTDLPETSNATINNAAQVNPSFMPDVDGSYTLQLVVSDGLSESLADSIIVTATSQTQNSIPVADAGSDKNVNTGQNTQLTGIDSYDENGDSFTYQWVFISRPDGSHTVINDARFVNPTFTPDIDGRYTLQLIVNDGFANSIGDSVVITSSTPNSPPVANAGIDQNIATLQSVQLTGAASSDANNDDLTYLWSFDSRPLASSAVLSNSSLVNPTFTADVDGIYTLKLIVSDGLVDSAADTVTIISTTENIAPVANAGIDQNIATLQSVQLTGAASSDANNDDLTYLWSFDSKPATSSSVFDSALIVNPIFIPDVDGIYTLQLIVSDGLLDSSADTATIIASSTISVTDDFSGNGSLLDYTTNRESDLPDVSRTAGRYRANLTNNAADITLHYNNFQGRLDAKLAEFPFVYIARNIGIGTQADSQIAPAGTGNPFIFAGVQVHVLDLESRNSSHFVVGHRGSSKYFTIEGKHTLNGSSNVTDEGANIAPNGRADLRLQGNSDHTLTVSWQLPNLTGDSLNDSWTLYNGSGNLTSNNSNSPSYGAQVYIGLITYAQGSIGLPFVGTSDGIEFNP